MTRTFLGIVACYLHVPGSLPESRDLTMPAHTLFATSCLVLATLGQAQPPRSGGPLLASPAAIIPGPDTTDLNGNPLSTQDIQAKKPGISRVQSLAWNPTEPDFSKLFAQAGLEVDAMSLGEDMIASNCMGIVTMPPTAWNTMLFTVDRTTKGARGSTIEREAMAPGGASADVLSYVLPKSNLPTGVGDTERAMDSTELGLQGRSGPGQIAALDAYIPLYKSPVLSTLLTNSPTVYFSLRIPNATSTATSVAQWFAPRQPSGATILQTKWDPRLRAWSKPRPFVEYRDLGLQATDEVDALAYDRAQNMILFSTEKAPVQQQLKILCLGPDLMAAVDYEEPGGGKVAVQAGVATGGNIVGVCTIDPARNPNAVYPSFTWGTAGPPLALPFPTDLGAAVYRTCGPPGRDAYHTLMIGWPGGSARPGNAFLLLQLGGTWFPFGPFPRNPANPIAGDPIEFPPILTMPVLFNVPMTGVWIAVDAGFNVASLSHPIVIRL